jgi:hypothetical protein
MFPIETLASENHEFLDARRLTQVLRQGLWACSSCLLPLPFRLHEPLGHLLVFRGHARPTLCSSVPA